jgi:hypothetical protein
VRVRGVLLPHWWAVLGWAHLASSATGEGLLLLLAAAAAAAAAVAANGLRAVGDGVECSQGRCVG